MQAESYESLLKENAELKGQLVSLQFQLAEMKRLIFGAKSEKFISSAANAVDTPSLFNLDAIQAAEVAKKKLVKYNKTVKPEGTKPTGRQMLPENLEREVVEINPVEDITGLTKIGEEVTERLDYTPGKIFVKRYVRAKYAKTIDAAIGTTQVLIGKLPTAPIEKGIPEAGLLAQICVDKYADHLPIYRQIKRYDRLGMKLNASTINGWLEGINTLLSPLYAALGKVIKSSNYVQADESPIKVLEDTKAKAHQGYMWLYRDPIKRLVYFDYKKGRDSSGPIQFLELFQGYLQTDGYGAYENPRIGGKAGVQLMHCMAHARRYAEKSLEYDKKRSEYFLSEIQKLYAIERNIRENSLTSEQILAERQQKAKPILESLGVWLKENYTQVLPGTPIGKAIGYALQRWDKLSIYITQPFLEIDNNGIENLVRPLTLGRRNFLFAGSHHGAERIALLYSLMGCCKAHDINPYAYLKDVLQRLADYPQKKIEDLLPHNWHPLTEEPSN